MNPLMVVPLAVAHQVRLALKLNETMAALPLRPTRPMRLKHLDCVYKPEDVYSGCKDV